MGNRLTVGAGAERIEIAVFEAAFAHVDLGIVFNDQFK